MARVSSCCCGCSLKTGTILIGVFYLVFCILSIIILSFSLITISDKSWQNEIIKVQGIATHAKNQGVDTQAKDQGVDKLANYVIDKIFVITQVILGITLSIVILGALLNVMLIVGAVQEKARLVLIWFVIHTILLIVNAVLIITNGIAGVGRSGSTGTSVGSTVITILLTIYFLIVVYSYYKELQEKGGPRTLGQPPSFQIQGYPMPPRNQIQGYPMQAPKASPEY